MRMVLERIERPSIVGDLDVRAKIFLVVLASTLIFVWDSVVYQAIMFAVASALAVSAHVPVSYFRKLFGAMIPLFVIVIAIHGLFNPHAVTVLIGVPDGVPLVGGRLALYREGLLFGIMVIFRLLTPLVVLPMVVMTTDVNDLMLGLVRMKVPYKVAFVFSIGLRFVPFIFSELDSIKEAQRLRGLAIEQMRWYRRVPLFASLLIPLMLGSLMKAQTLEVALQSKAFSGSSERTFINEIRFRSVDAAVVAAGLLILVVGTFMRIRYGWGSFS